MSRKPSNEKRCRSCGFSKPVRDYPLPRHRICTDCQNGRKFGAAPATVQRRGETGPQKPTQWQQVQWWINERQNVPLHTPLTVTQLGSNKNQRERKRMEIAQRYAAQAAYRRLHGIPDPDPRWRSCRHCKDYLPPARFANPYVRICKKCDGPALILPHVVDKE